MSELNGRIEVEGVKDALATLRSIDPKLRTQATRDLKSAGSSLLAAPKKNYPTTAPLSRWPKTQASGLGYDPGKAQRSVQIRVGGRTPKGSRVAPIISIVQSNRGAAMYDVAGLRNGSQGKAGRRGQAFIENLDRKHGKAQRGLWRASGEVLASADAVLRDALDKVVADANAHLRSSGAS